MIILGVIAAIDALDRKSHDRSHRYSRLFAFG
jgi:hypothetical protein